MWLLPIPLPCEERIQLPQGRYFFPWYFRTAEIDRLAELLAGMLSGVERSVVVPWPAVPALTEGAPPAALATTLVVVKIEDPNLDDATIEDVTARLSCRHAMLHAMQPRPGGYAWQERYVKGPLVDSIRDYVSGPDHPLGALNIQALPVRLAASLAADTLGVIELLEATIEHRLRRAADGTSEVDYEASLYAAAGQRLAERMLWLLPSQLDAALEVLRAEGVGVWNDERFRTGARALEEVGLAQVAGGSVSLNPLARRAKDARILEALRTTLARRLPLVPARRWVVEASPIVGDLRAARASHNMVEFAAASVAVATGLLRVLREGTPTVAGPIEGIDGVRRWIGDGADFEERRRRAQDFLSDPDRSTLVRTDPYAEYQAWLEVLRSEFADEEWKLASSLHIDDLRYDETQPRANTRRSSVPATSGFTGFRVLDRKRFSVLEQLPRQIDALLDKRPELGLEIARWLTFAHEQGLLKDHQPAALDLASWLWARVVLASLGGDEARREANAAIRKCVAIALKNGYEHVREHAASDAKSLGLDISGVLPGGERAPDFVQKTRAGFDKMLEGAFDDARDAYQHAAASARERGDAFGEWAALHGEEDAFLAGLDRSERREQTASSETKANAADYRRRRQALEQSPAIKDWLEEARRARERVVEATVGRFVERERRRSAGGESRSLNNYIHDYWTIFRDLETIHAPPNLQRVHVQPLVDAGAFPPEEELHHRLQLGVDKTEKTAAWISRIVDEPAVSLKDATERDGKLLDEFIRKDVSRFERANRLEVFPQVAKILRVEDLDWAAAFLVECKSEFGSVVETHRGGRALHHDYADGWLAYADCELRSVIVDRLSSYAATISNTIEHERFSRTLQHLPLEQWAGNLQEPPERLVRLVLDSASGVASEAGQIWDSDESVAWALFAIARGAKRFGRPIEPATQAEAQRWAAGVLQKAPSENRPTRDGTRNAALRVAYALADDHAARETLTHDVLAGMGRLDEPGALEESLGLWAGLVDAGASATSDAMTDAAAKLSARLDDVWNEALRFVTNNPHHAWPYVAFLARRIAWVAVPASARHNLLALLEVAPGQLWLCAKILDPKFWGTEWPLFVAQLWRLTAEGGSDPVVARAGAAYLLVRWAADAKDAEELPADLRFLVDACVLASRDESALVANHAAYGVVSWATVARAPADVARVARALRSIARDTRLGVRGAAAYSGGMLTLRGAVPELRSTAQEIDAAMATERYAAIQRQRRFGEVDARHPARP